MHYGGSGKSSQDCAKTQTGHMKPGNSNPNLNFKPGKEKIANPELLAYIGDINFLYFSGILFLFCVLLICLVSYQTELPDENQIDGLTYQTIDKEAIRESWDQKDIYATGVILGLVLAIYLYFSFWI